MFTPKISIIIPVYNVEKYIERCALSIFSQDYSNLEILFVDDCSPDNSVGVLKRLINNCLERKGQVQILHHKKNMGVSVARNTALKAITGEFVMFVDADDYLLPNAVKQLVSCQQLNNSDIASGAFVIDYGKRKEILNDQLFSSVNDLLYYCCCSSGGHNNVARIFRTSLLNNPPVYYRPGVKYGEDWIFFVEVLLRAHSLSSTKDIVYYYDFTNQSSAMHSVLKPEQICDFMLNGIRVINEIRKIVAPRGQLLSEKCMELMSERLNNGLYQATVNSNLGKFRELAHFIPLVLPVQNRWPSLMKRRNILGHQFFLIWWLDNWAIRLKKRLLSFIYCRKKQSQ